MFAKPNEIGSAESLTTEIENVAGSLRLNVALPFEARRYEFSLPAGEETLDGSNEDEVPVLRRVIDTHAGEVIRTTSLPTVIKEVLVARCGGVISGNDWLSARATLSPSNSGATDEEVRNAIEGFEASNEAVLMTDGGRERLPRFCPNDDERLEPKDDEPLEVVCPQCGYSSPRSLRGETVKVCHKKASISENSRGENEAYMATLEIGGIENRIAVTREFVREELSEDKPGVMTDGGRDIEEDEEPPRWRDWSNVKGERDGRLMTDGGSDQPRTLRENPIENGNKAMEDINRLESSCSDCGETFPVGQLYWFNRQTFRCSDCHPDIEPVTDGGQRVHPDDEGVELLDESGNDDDIIEAPDDGEILTDGGEERVEFRYENNAGTVRVIREWRLIGQSSVIETDVEKMYNHSQECWEVVHSFEREYQVTDDGLLVGDGSGWDGDGRLWHEYAEERHEERLRIRFPHDFGNSDDGTTLRDAVEDIVRGQIE